MRVVNKGLFWWYFGRLCCVCDCRYFWMGFGGMEGGVGGDWRSCGVCRRGVEFLFVLGFFCCGILYV